MNAFDLLLAVATAGTLAGIVLVAYLIGLICTRQRVTWGGLVVLGLMAAGAAPGTAHMIRWTLAAQEHPAPETVQWQDLEVDENASFMTRQVAWASLKTGIVKPAVRRGFYYSTATFGEGEDQVNLVWYPADGVTKWRKL